jgi:porphobilinogen synthase
MTIQRLAKLRRSPTVRALLSETRLHPDDFIVPLFLHAGLKKSIDIPSMPGYQQLAWSDLAQEAEYLLSLGLKAVLLFGIPEHKDALGSASWQEDGIIQQACRFLKSRYPELLVIADLCFCEYTDHGHCGIVHDEQLDHDATLTLLNRQALSLAQAGVDWLAPSGMIDGMIGSLRQALDAQGFTQTALLSYAVKYQSHLYGPFREAAEGAPQFGDRSTYQMNPANAYEALREVAIDVREGADLVMVKPAMLYQDIMIRIKQQHPEIPLCAYQVSGEYAMIKQAGKCKIANEALLMQESLIALKRSGADLIISYFAKSWAEQHRKNS